MSLLRRLAGLIPTLLLSAALAVAVWISAVTSSDPLEERNFPNPIQIEIVGQNPAMILTPSGSDQLSLRLSAPQSIWERLTTDHNPVRALVDLSGLGPGTYDLPVQIQINLTPVRIVSSSPLTYRVTLEKLETLSLPIKLISKGEPAIGYEAGLATLSQTTATISGPVSVVDRVKSLQTVIDLAQANQDINKSLSVQPLDENGLVVSGLTLSPENITVMQPITQRGGYRNVVVKVVTTGQVGEGYRLTTISVFPPTVTVFASDPTLVDKLPGYVETSPIDMNARKDDIDVRLPLNLPEGISVVGDSTVNVVVGIAAIEGSITLNELPVQVINLDPTLAAKISPERVNIILSGPLPVLDKLQSNQIRVLLDLGGKEAGTYQLAPKVDLGTLELRVESILPGSIEVVVSPSGTLTPGAPSP